jgi:broad specificity phosphatase PhoE
MAGRRCLVLLACGANVGSYGLTLSSFRSPHVPQPSQDVVEGELPEGDPTKLGGRFGPLFGWLEQRLERWRRRNRPKRIILVRHGESIGNVNKSAVSQQKTPPPTATRHNKQPTHILPSQLTPAGQLLLWLTSTGNRARSRLRFLLFVQYATTPDSQISLTPRGFDQGAGCGREIRRLVGNERTRFYYSPYLRARQTLLSILQAFEGTPVEITSEPRLREQDFGNFQDPQQMQRILAERQEYGRFFYRFPNGEAGTDVFDRMSDFLSTLFASFDSGRMKAENCVLMTHGLLMRIFCMCYLRWTVSEFEQVWNPTNCEIWVLEKVAATGRYELAGRWELEQGNFVDIRFGKNRNEAMKGYMKQTSDARTIVPAPGMVNEDSLRSLRDGTWGDELALGLPFTVEGYEAHVRLKQAAVKLTRELKGAKQSRRVAEPLTTAATASA